MSDFINHHYCGEDALGLINKEPRQIIEKNRILYNLGCQGPDFFLYHGALPWNKHSFAPLGSKIHASETNKLFMKSVEYIKNLPNQAMRERAIAYLMGFACHHSLDAFSHPFIYYFSGKDNDLHKEYEMILDVLNSQLYGRKPAIDFDFTALFDLSNEDLSVVTSIYTYLFKELHQISMPEEAVASSIQKYAFLLRLFPDRNGFKRKISKAIEKIIKHPHIISKVFIQSNIRDIDDYLNLTQQIWLHPCDKNITSKESYPDLFDRSIHDASQKINALYHFIQEPFSPSDLSNVIRNLSFETGEIFQYENNQNIIEMKWFKPKQIS
ncbi:MAG: zinc dependent phospholipase C family protein [Tissierellales bacterium]|nr:zinc dependent phospholipase C family protein [Tissierellales bacterium]MBN2827280.1 zinc dependent phospholipase C family protein [Tissierellales bacterium]